MGLSLMRHFSEMENEVKVLFVNRGNVYWGNESSKIMSMQQGRFEQVFADRDEDQFVEKVKEAIGDRHVLGVVDFCCYKVKEAEKGIAVVPPGTKYIYISTDSSYDCSGFLID